MNLEIIVGKNYLGNYQMKYLTEFDLYNIVLVFFYVLEKDIFFQCLSEKIKQGNMLKDV